MKIIKVDLEKKIDVAKFLSLPYQIYRDNPIWVPPLQGEEAGKLNAHKNPFFQHSEAGFFIVINESGDPIARVAVLQNKRYNDYNNENTAFFYMFESKPDQEATLMIMNAVADWSKARGLNKIIGPKGFTALDGLGLLVKGFDHRPAFGIPYNPSYYPEYMELAGFSPKSEMVSGYLNGKLPFPDSIHEISKKVQAKKGLRVHRYTTRRELRTLGTKFKQLYNAAIEGTPGNVPLTDTEAKAMMNQIVWFADPRFIKILFADKDPVGFLFAYPDISAAIQKNRGKIFPMGWIEIFREMKRTKWVNINGAGIAEQYRGQGGTAILFSEMAKSIQEGRFEHADIVQIGADNVRMLNELKSLGIDFYKLHRMYQRDL